MSNICLSCGGYISNSAPHFMQSDRRKGLSGQWKLVECNKCGVISIMPIPTGEQLATYYTSYSKGDTTNLTPRAGTRFPIIRKLFHLFSGDVDPRDFVNVPNGARVLDYGCGNAGYLSDFHARGVAISGAEIAENVVEACRNNGLDVHKVDVSSHTPFSDGEFDIVYLMQVFEHLGDPQSFFDELARILKSGGILYLAVPNAASFWRNVFGCNWISGWYAPFHLFHYSQDALRQLARKHGFNMVKYWSSTPESWFRLNIKAVLYPHENKLDWHRSWIDHSIVRLILMLVLRIVELTVRQRDCMVMKLEKR